MTSYILAVRIKTSPHKEMFFFFFVWDNYVFTVHCKILEACHWSILVVKAYQEMIPQPAGKVWLYNLCCSSLSVRRNIGIKGSQVGPYSDSNIGTEGFQVGPDPKSTIK